MGFSSQLRQFPQMIIALDKYKGICLRHHQRGSCMVWKINMGVCPRLDFDNIILFNCLGYNFNIYGAFEFLCNSIANL